MLTRNVCASCFAVKLKASTTPDQCRLSCRSGTLSLNAVMLQHVVLHPAGCISTHNNIADCLSILNNIAACKFADSPLLYWCVQARVQEFQTRDDIPVFLLTSQVGGLGLTLTAADRVIIVDPAWNPSVDNQSVDRAYRIGQRKDVIVYRLITCGTVEEKIYRKQVFKGGLSRSGTEEGVQFRYFSQQVS